MKKRLTLLIINILLVSGLYAQADKPQDFSFIFMTDIHLEPGRNAPEGFQMAIDTANKLGADFVITGGDLIADALGASYGQADSLYQLYEEMIKGFNMPVYNTIGNHELYGIYRKSGTDTNHPDYCYGMYERYLGPTYYSFDHKGWHFIILNSTVDANDQYIGYIDSAQMEWLKQDISETDPATPIIISSHIPFFTVFNQIRFGSLMPNSNGFVVANSREILINLYEHNLKLVLQGHLHIIEAINLQNRFTFLTGGAVSANWWKGPNEGMEEGFMLIKLNDEHISWEYIDFGFEAGNK